MKRALLLVAATVLLSPAAVAQPHFTTFNYGGELLLDATSPTPPEHI